MPFGRLATLSPHRRILLATIALALAVPTVATAAPTPPDHLTTTRPRGAVNSAVRPRVLDGEARISVMVQLAGDPVAVAEARSGRSYTSADRKRVKQDLRKAQDAVAGAIVARGGKVLSHLQSAYNGMRVRISRAKAATLAELPGVVAVHAITPRTIDNARSVPYLGVPQVWEDTGYTGKGVKVAIIDTGIDYTHADFGGPGTAEAFEAASAGSSEAPDPDLFGPAAPRVKGGYDFVGDDYDSAADPDSPALVPQPDSNPLDCNGHGTHVAGTAGGSGVTSEGTTYAGPYDSATPTTGFEVGPGVAPEVDLYALRIFGCEGASELTTDAIDWAVDHQMDVINLSLGGAFGRSDDPDAVAAANAVGAGVVVVASSGNAGQSPYLTGSPGAGEGVISVAAVDSAGTLPGADLELGDETIRAINANGADLPTGDLTVVSLAGGQTGDDALGCSVAAFERAGISADPDAPAQIAVVDRGVCDKVAKAAYGQVAGAEAVVMIDNTTDPFPAYEGQVTYPVDGVPVEVTIPFLGVPASSGPALVAAAGQTLTLSAAEVPNPEARRYAPNSSAGPVNGDSGLSPSISAPGVRIASAGMGSGTGAAVYTGTSMAAPHVAGVAALGVQAHPGWAAQDVAAAVVSTADPDRVSGYKVTSGGGLVDARQAVTTRTFATGDTFRTESGKAAEATLSFGFAEPMKAFVGTRVLTIHNRSNRAVTYRLSREKATAQGKSRVRFSNSVVRVPAGGRTRVFVTLVAPAAAVGSSLVAGDQSGFREVSGNVLITSAEGTLRVPFLLVPRAQANVEADLRWSRAGALTSASANARPLALSVRLSNRSGALAAVADFYTWGLADARDVGRASGGGGYDLRAAGVQAWDSDRGKVLVFAVNNHDRWSTAATQEFDVSVDVDRDGAADFVVFSYDSGAMYTGQFNGVTEVFVLDLATGGLQAAGYLAVAPTDSSTILLQVDAASLGLSADSGPFSYTVNSYTIEDGAAGDGFSGWAAYDPWAKAVSDGDYLTVARNGRETVGVTVDRGEFGAQSPKGVMVVVFDNASGRDEALLLGIG
ncbi:MAG: S8 family serine peptidase [Propionibacteriaceae bacterium]|nr:S8 family serine peptidase [Propionibacteriaceae bacterium]